MSNTANRGLSALRYVYVWADRVYLQAWMEEAAERMLVLNSRKPLIRHTENSFGWHCSGFRDLNPYASTTWQAQIFKTEIELAKLG